MESIYKDDKGKKISKPEDVTFTVKAKGIYLIEISARVKNEKQLGGTDDEDLGFEIDKRKFPQINNSKRYFDSPASFSGGSSKGLKKTVYIFTPLNTGKHIISFISDISAILLSLEIFKISEDSSLNELDLTINEQAEDGDRRSWITFALVDLGFGKFIVELNLKKRFIDSDDVKVIVDGNVKRNYRSILHKFWYFIASLFAPEGQIETFTEDLPIGLHYIEFWADRMPTFEKITFLQLTSQSNAKPEETIQDKIRQKAEEFGLDPEIILRLVQKESSFDPNSTSPKGAKGLFQLTDITIEQIAKLGFKIDDPHDIDQNIQGGLIYFKWLFDQYAGDPEQLEKTLAAWNWGLNNFPKEEPLDYGSLPGETKEFIRYILNK